MKEKMVRVQFPPNLEEMQLHFEVSEAHAGRADRAVPYSVIHGAVYTPSGGGHCGVVYIWVSTAYEPPLLSEGRRAVATSGCDDASLLRVDFCDRRSIYHASLVPALVRRSRACAIYVGATAPKVRLKTNASCHSPATTERCVDPAYCR
jgi:hypothetical protein